MHRSIILGLAFAIALQCADSIAAENWPQWRGPFGTGVAADGDYPVKFSSTEGLAWKAQLPGIGTSTPAVWDDRIFVTCGIEDAAGKSHDSVVCYDMKGQGLWRRQFGVERPGRNPHASGSNPSPATDGKHLVVYYKSGTLACLDLAGNEKWKINLQDKFGKDTLWWDLGTSPLLWRDRVIVAVFQGGDSYLVALDLKSGDVVWKQQRQYETPNENDNSYCTPQIVKLDGKDVIVGWGADHLTGNDAASGKLLWEWTGFNPEDMSNWRTIASAVVSDGFAIVPYARGDSLTGIPLGSSGDITKSDRVWNKSDRGLSADVPTPAAKSGRLYLLTDKGQISCRDIRTGEEHWSAKLPPKSSKYYASPVLAGDKLYCVREDGAVFVGRVSKEGFELLADHNDMGERIIATMVPIRGGLLIRGDEYLYMIGAGGAVGK